MRHFSARFTLYGPGVVTVSLDNTARLWNYETKKCVAILAVIVSLCRSGSRSGTNFSTPAATARQALGPEALPAAKRFFRRRRPLSNRPNELDFQSSSSNSNFYFKGIAKVRRQPFPIAFAQSGRGPRQTATERRNYSQAAFEMSYRITSRRLAVFHRCGRECKCLADLAERRWRHFASLRSSRVTISDAMPCTFATLVSAEREASQLYFVFASAGFGSPRAHMITSALGASGSCRDTITGRVLARGQISQPHFTGTGIIKLV